MQMENTLLSQKHHIIHIIGFFLFVKYNQNWSVFTSSSTDWIFRNDEQ